jgi:hypothetical protein
MQLQKALEQQFEAISVCFLRVNFFVEQKIYK